MADKKPTQEQIKEFWEWCGFTFTPNFDDPSIIEESRSPIGERLNPPLDLNNLFKYAVPKSINQMKVNWEERHDTILTECGAYDNLFRAWWWKIVADEDPALALF